MSNITDPIRDIFLAGVGALAIGAEKSQEVVEQLVKKGQITVDQGKEITEDLKDQSSENLAKVRDEIIKAHMSTMTKDERDDFAAHVAEMAANMDVDAAMEAQEADEVAIAAEQEA